MENREPSLPALHGSDAGGLEPMLPGILWGTWRDNLTRTAALLALKGATDFELEVGPPASEEEFEAVRRCIALPDEFCSVLCGFASRLSLRWRLSPEPPPPFHDVRYGQLSWDIAEILGLAGEVKGWYSLRKDPADVAVHGVVRNRIPFARISGGFLAFDLSRGRRNCPVFQMSHRGGDYAGTGNRICGNFIDFMTHWTALGCPSPDRLTPFRDAATGELLAYGPMVEGWKRWLAENPEIPQAVYDEDTIVALEDSDDDMPAVLGFTRPGSRPSRWGGCG